MEERLIRRLMASMKCESCGQQYEMYDIDVLGHREDLWFLKVSCPACHTQCLVAVAVRQKRMPVAVTDLTGEETSKFIDGDVVGTDDLLNMHNFLRNFDGDFSRLLGQG